MSYVVRLSPYKRLDAADKCLARARGTTEKSSGGWRDGSSQLSSTDHSFDCYPTTSLIETLVDSVTPWQSRLNKSFQSDNISHSRSLSKALLHFGFAAILNMIMMTFIRSVMNVITCYRVSSKFGNVL